MWRAVDAAAARIVEMVAEDLKPRDILTPAAFGNAVTTILAASGSINSVKHLQAVAAEAEAGADVYRLFETLADGVPLLTAIRPNGETPIEEFEDAGGTRALMKQLEPLLDGTALTVTGRTVAQNLDGVTAANPEVIRPPERALGRRPTIVLIRGSLCPDGGIVKLAVADDRRLDFAGPAIVFESALEALDGVRAGLVTAGQVVVLRGLGVTGSPGMGMASQLVFALDGAGLTGQVAVVTDGQLSGLVNKGIVVGEVSPEAAAGGPLGLVRDGGHDPDRRPGAHRRPRGRAGRTGRAQGRAGRQPARAPGPRSAGCRSTSAWCGRCPRARSSGQGRRSPREAGNRDGHPTR